MTSPTQWTQQMFIDQYGFARIYVDDDEIIISPERVKPFATAVLAFAEKIERAPKGDPKND